MISNLKVLTFTIFSLLVIATASAKYNQETKQSEKVLNLGNGFTLNLGDAEDFGDFITYSYLKLSRGGSTIFVDKKREYEFSDKLYPILLKTGENSFQLLLEVNDRPNKIYLEKLDIRNNKLVKSEKLPTFLTKPCDLNGNGKLIYAGFWDYNQTWDDSLTGYNPMLFYIQDTKGLGLDFTLTIKTNREIYGNFYGFEYNENQVQNVKCLDKFRTVTERIENKCK